MLRTILSAALIAAAATADDVADAGRLFKSACAGCHSVPDRDLRGDRAWLAQVQGTA